MSYIYVDKFNVISEKFLDGEQKFLDGEQNMALLWSLSAKVDQSHQPAPGGFHFSVICRLMP